MLLHPRCLQLLKGGIELLTQSLKCHLKVAQGPYRSVRQQLLTHVLSSLDSALFLFFKFYIDIFLLFISPTLKMLNKKYYHFLTHTEYTRVLL